MYCSNCGTKNKEEAIFCEECGKKIKGHKKVLKTKRNLSKKYKIMITIAIVMIAIISLGFVFLSHQTSPKTVAQHYMEALIKGDIDKLYSYLEIKGDKTFVTKEIYQELLKTEKPFNYHISDTQYGHGNLTATVTFIYTESDSKEEKTKTITLLKQKQKKYLFFDTWKISNSETTDNIVENFKIVVPKNAKVTYAGKKVTEQYLDQNDSTETTDIYVLNQVFRASTNLIVELENGYRIEDEIIPSAYKKTYTANVSLNDISKEEQEKIKSVVKNDLTILYEGAIQDKSFDSLEQLKIGEKKEAIEKKYQTLKEKLKQSYTVLTGIEFTNISLSSVKLEEQGNLEFRFKANYQYNIQYLDSASVEQAKSLKSYTYMNLSYYIKDGTYYLVDADNLEDHFSRY